MFSLRLLSYSHVMGGDNKIPPVLEWIIVLFMTTKCY
jgi:hypothetical protein